MADERARTDADDQGATRTRKGAFAHLKRYGVIYGVAAVVLLVLVLLPSVSGDDDEDESTDAAAIEPGDPEGPWQPGSGDLEHGTGTTRGGITCEPGVPQIEATVLAAPCLPEFTGDNGGETFRGVTGDTITLVRREFPDSANSDAVESELEEAGFATEEVSDEIRDQYFDHLEDQYELYGRDVEIVEYESQFSDSTAESLGQGREGACQDATQIVEELDAFGVIGVNSAVFAECAAERELVVFQAASYYPERFYEDLHPYAWNTSMDCERISEHVAAYVGTRLAGEPAEHAGDPELAAATRVFGSYNPDNDQYVHCNDMSRELLEENYDDVETTQPIRYALDISRFAEQAARAVVQWKADGVTTVILRADPISVAYLTNAAEDQDYHPEWLITGSSGTDTNTFGRDYAQAQVDGHMFGLSQISGDEVLYGTDGEPARLYQELNGEEIPGGTTGDLYASVHVLNLLQAAGPDLTPETIAAGVRTMPPLGGDGRVTWWFGDNHTATRDAREIYWDGSAPPGPAAHDQSLEGAFLETDGQRYMPDEWPAEPPAVYPEG